MNKPEIKKNIAENLSGLFNESFIPQDALKIIENFDQIVQGVRPLNSKQMQLLPENIKALSHQMTDERSTRRLGYMNENVQLSAYVRYYSWWNLVRLTRLFSNLPESSFINKDGICLDLGSGPLSVVTALFLARPEMRKLKLTWYCLDVSLNSLSLGEDIFLSVNAKLNEETNWKIIRVKGSFGTMIKQKADFITCANMLNELDQSNKMPPEYQTKKYFDQFKIYASENCNFLLIEPGFPKAARTLSLLRQRFINDGYFLNAPCPHYFECPMNGFKAYTGSSNKWCNFAFSTESAPKKLQILSDKAKLPKERATLSFISVVSKTQDEVQNKNRLLLRICSDGFRLPEHKTGFYACSKLGLTLVTAKNPQKMNLCSGALISTQLLRPEDKLEIDKKSNAKIVPLD